MKFNLTYHCEEYENNFITMDNTSNIEKLSIVVNDYSGEIELKIKPVNFHHENYEEEELPFEESLPFIEELLESESDEVIDFPENSIPDIEV